MKLHERLLHLPPQMALAAALSLVLVVGLVDAITGQEISFSVFYLIPVTLSASACPRPQRLAICLLAGVTSLGADFAMSPKFSEAWIPYWNALARSGIFVIASELTAQLVARNISLQKEVVEREQTQKQLQELNATLEEKVLERTLAVETRSVQLGQSESALRKQTEILHSILNCMGDGVIVADAQGKIMLRNPEADRLLGLDGSTTRIQDWLENQRTYLPEVLTDGRGDRNHPLIRVLSGEAVAVAEMCVPRRDHPTGLWMRTTARPLVDEEGSVRGGVIVLNDMTSRKLLEKQVAEISDREQRRIGQDLHDGVCQHLVSTALACNMLAETLGEKGLPEAEQATEISRLIKQAVAQARNLAHALYCLDLTGDGLICALEELADSVQHATNTVCRFEGDRSLSMHDPGIAMNLFRIAQEGVNNAVKHGCGSEILLRLSQSDDLVTLTD